MRNLIDGREAEILSDYRSGMRVVDLARKYHARKETISRVLRLTVDLSRGRVERSKEARLSRPINIAVEKSLGLTKCPSNTEWAYIAGLFDGEGSLSFEANNGQNYRVNIFQKGTYLHEWMIEKTGVGYVSGKGGGTHKNVFAWRLHQQKAVFQFLLGVRPYVIVKKQKTEDAIAYLGARYGWEEDPHGD